MSVKPFFDFLRESIELSHSDIQACLADCLRDQFPNGYPYVRDVFGDSESGDVVYYANGDHFRAPYECGTANGNRVCTIHFDQAVEVIPRTVYDQMADDDDHVASMSEADRVERFPGSGGDRIPFSERFISKAERDAADASDFAGEGKSFPILKPSDVAAAVRSIGRGVAGGQSAQKLKNRIIAIAKRKGWTKFLPASWRGDDDGATESAAESAGQEIDLTGDVVDLREGAVGQDGTVSLKLIAPGWGSSGYYPAAVLERDGPRIFRTGTLNFWDHMTDAQEAARPEGSLRDLASVLTEDARWDPKGSEGPGLYARAKVFSEFRQPVDDLARHIGVSIRAAGIAREGEAEGRTGRIIEKLTRGDSVDYVTRPGAGGKVLQLFESARHGGASSQSKTEVEDMDVTKLQERLDNQDRVLTRILRESALRNAATLIDGHLAGVRIGEAVKSRVRATVLESLELNAEQQFDAAKLKEAVQAALTAEVNYLEAVAPTGRVANLGTSAPTAADLADQEKQFRESQDAALDDLAELMVGSGDANKAKRDAFRTGRAA